MSYTEAIVETIISLKRRAEEVEQGGTAEAVAYQNGLLEGYLQGLRAVLNGKLVDALVADAERAQ